jgi:membrane protein implicated in regulation of membrane protease activity
MRQRVRKLFGTIVLVVFIAFYALAAMTIASAKLPGTPGWVQLVFFVVVGLLWVIPAAALVSWMQKPDRSEP